MAEEKTTGAESRPASPTRTWALNWTTTLRATSIGAFWAIFAFAQVDKLLVWPQLDWRIEAWRTWGTWVIRGFCLVGLFVYIAHTRKLTRMLKNPELPFENEQLQASLNFAFKVGLGGQLLLGFVFILFDAMLWQFHTSYPMGLVLLIISITTIPIPARWTALSCVAILPTAFSIAGAGAWIFGGFNAHQADGFLTNAAFIYSAGFLCWLSACLRERKLGEKWARARVEGDCWLDTSGAPLPKTSFPRLDRFLWKGPWEVEARTVLHRVANFLCRRFQQLDRFLTDDSKHLDGARSPLAWTRGWVFSLHFTARGALLALVVFGLVDGFFVWPNLAESVGEGRKWLTVGIRGGCGLYLAYYIWRTGPLFRRLRDKPREFEWPRAADELDFAFTHGLFAHCLIGMAFISLDWLLAQFHTSYPMGLLLLFIAIATVPIPWRWTAITCWGILPTCFLAAGLAAYLPYGAAGPDIDAFEVLGLLLNAAFIYTGGLLCCVAASMREPKLKQKWAQAKEENGQWLDSESKPLPMTNFKIFDEFLWLKTQSKPYWTYGTPVIAALSLLGYLFSSLLSFVMPIGLSLLLYAVESRKASNQSTS